MPHNRRQPTPAGQHTDHAGKTAPVVLQRRLRQTVSEVEWRDAIAGALLGQLLDALGGSGLTPDIIQRILALLGIGNQ